MKKIVYISILFCILLIHSLNAANQIQFEKCWLEEPQKYKVKFDSIFAIQQTDVFHYTSSSSSVLLRNAYAQALIANPRAWIPGIKSRKVTSIQLIFTQYPKHKKDWICNYYLLLAERLKALFAIDSSLNSKEIRWEIILQTQCPDESYAKQLFHGIRINYEFHFQDIADSQKAETTAAKIKETSTPEMKQVYVPHSEVSKPVLQAGDAYNSIRKIETREIVDKRNRKGISCPDFSQKSSFWNRFKKK